MIESSGSVDVGLVLALTFHHGDLEPDYVGVSTRGEGGLMCGNKILCAKNVGGAYARGGAYLRDNTVFALCYSKTHTVVSKPVGNSTQVQCMTIYCQVP